MCVNLSRLRRSKLLTFFFIGFMLSSCSEDSEKPTTPCYLTSLTIEGNSINPSHTTYFEYDADNKIILQTDWWDVIGETSIEYTYANENLILSVDNQYQYQSRHTFLYDANNRLMRVESETESTSEDLTYNSSGQLIEFDGWTFIYPNTTTNNFSSKQKDGDKVEYEYDNKPNPYKLWHPGVHLLHFSSIATDNNPIKTTVSGTTRPNEYEYNDFGYPVRLVDFYGRRSSMEYSCEQ